MSPLSKKNFKLEEETMIDLNELSEADKGINFSPERNKNFDKSDLFEEYQTKQQLLIKNKEIKRELDENFYQRTGIKGRLIK